MTKIIDCEYSVNDTQYETRFVKCITMSNLVVFLTTPVHYNKKGKISVPLISCFFISSDGFQRFDHSLSLSYIWYGGSEHKNISDGEL